MKLYVLERDEDHSGVSGIGVIADVAEFPNGWCAVSFRPGNADVSNGIWYSSLADVDRIHGHGGSTRLVLTKEPTS